MEKKRFWHIDHMLASTQASIRDIYVTNLTEEEMVLPLEESGKIKQYDAYFGASDSTRKTHLFYCKNYSELCRVKGLMDTWQ